MKYLIAGLVLASALLGIGLYLQVKANGKQSVELDGTKKALSGLVEQRKRDERILVARHKEIVLQGRKLAQAQEGLSQALEANSIWSEGKVPADVFEALVGDSDASK